MCDCESGLLDLDLGASRFDLLLDLFGFFLGDAFLEGLRSALDERLGFGEAEAGDAARTSLMTAILLAPVSLRMTSNAVFSSTGAAAAPPPAGGGDGHRSSGADAPLLFELFHEISDFQDGKSAELFH